MPGGNHTCQPYTLPLSYNTPITFYIVLPNQVKGRKDIFQTYILVCQSTKIYEANITFQVPAL